jgi:Holliday junction DNA helicase RuvA
MYEYIKGDVSETAQDYAVIETGGIGYRVYTTTQSLARLSAGDKAKLYCHFVVREDAHTLYGFVSPEERQMFVRLTGVSGIGPKVALGILSAMTVSELCMAIIAADEGAFQKVSGVGKKTAQRLIIDLAEKIDTAEAIGTGDVAPTSGSAGIEAEAVSALVALGYKQAEAMKAVSSVKNLGDTAEDIIIMALRRMGA